MPRKAHAPIPTLVPVKVASWRFILHTAGTFAMASRSLRNAHLPFDYELSCPDETPHILTVIAPPEAGPDLRRILAPWAIPASWEPPISREIKQWPRFELHALLQDGSRYVLPVPLQHPELFFHPSSKLASPTTPPSASRPSTRPGRNHPCYRWIAWGIKAWGERPVALVALLFGPHQTTLWRWGAENGVSADSLSRSYAARTEVAKLAQAYPEVRPLEKGTG